MDPERVYLSEMDIFATISESKESNNYKTNQINKIKLDLNNINLQLSEIIKKISDISLIINNIDK